MMAHFSSSFVRCEDYLGSRNILVFPGAMKRETTYSRPVIGEIFGHNQWRSECLHVQPVTC